MISNEILNASEAAERWPMICSEILDTLREAAAKRSAGLYCGDLISEAKRLADVLESDFRRHRKVIYENFGLIGIGEDTRPTAHHLSLESSRAIVSAIRMYGDPENRMGVDLLDIVAGGARWAKIGRDYALSAIEKVRNERASLIAKD